MTLSLGLFLIAIFTLSCLSTSIFKQQDGALAQQYIQTIKYRNLVIDLGNGVKTNAQLTLPAIGKGPFPGVLLIHGSGAFSMNDTQGPIRVDNKTGSKIYPIAQPLFQIAEYLSERGFAVLRYDKRGVGANATILDSNVWGNMTFNDLKQDAEKALAVLINQPEVDPNKITVLGHSEGTMIAPRVAVDYPDKVKNIVLMGPVSQNLFKVILYNEVVSIPLHYAEKVLDKSHQGSFSVKEASEDPIFQRLVGVPVLSHIIPTQNNVTDDHNKTKHDINNDHSISIEDELKPELMKAFENATSPQSSTLSAKCVVVTGCPIWIRSHNALDDTLSMIGNVSSHTSILILQGKNDSSTPLQQGLLLQQRLTQVNHPDHLLITYPDLGHLFYPTNEWMDSYPPGPIQEFVLQNMFEWLTSPAREVHEFIR